MVLIILGVWIVLWYFSRGTDTLALPARDHTPLHNTLTEFRDSVLASRDTNPLIQLTTNIADGFRAVFDWCSGWSRSPTSRGRSHRSAGSA